MVKSELGGAGRTFTILLVGLILLGLGGSVVYLLSQINHGQYRLSAHERTVIVERGRMLPFGFERFQPEAADLKNGYAPIPMPPGQNLGKSEIFLDRADIDRALFSLLASWARDRLKSEKPGDFELAASYVRRCELLPGLSEEQRIELRIMRADLAYRNGRRMLGDIVERLKKAREEFTLAKELGTSRKGDVDAWIADVERRIRDYQLDRVPKNPALLDPDLSVPPPPPVEEQSSDGTPEKKWRL